MMMTCSLFSPSIHAASNAGSIAFPGQDQGDSGFAALESGQLAHGGSGQGDSLCADALVRRGFEHVHVAQGHDTLYAGFENRVFRWPPRAMAEALVLLMPLAGDNATISLTLLRTGIPVVTLVVTKQQYRALVQDSLGVEGFAAAIKGLLPADAYRKATKNTRGLNSPFLKPDITIGPLLRLQLGNFTQPLEMQFSIVPAVQINFLKGLTFTGQVIVPLYNNLEPEGKYIRPGIVALSQAFRLPYNFFATVSAGYFTNNRYGIDGQVRKYFFNGRVAAGASLGYTGFAGYEGELWMYTYPETVTWSCDASWRWSRQDLTLRATVGSFIARDFGWRVDVSRQFREVTIGFFAMQTGGLTNGGFNFIVPIPPRKYSTKHRVRVRPASYVPWEYRAKGLPENGKSFSTGDGIDALMEGVNPDYVRTKVGGEVLRMTSDK